MLASPTAKRRMIEPLASVLKEGFRKRRERDFRKRDFGKRRYISKQEKDNNGLPYITLDREKLTTSHVTYSTSHFMSGSHIPSSHSEPFYVWSARHDIFDVSP